MSPIIAPTTDNRTPNPERPTAVPTPAMIDTFVSVERINGSWLVFIGHDRSTSLVPSFARRMSEALADAADIAARLNAPADVIDGANGHLRMVAAIAGSALTRVQWAAELGMSTGALQRRIEGVTNWTLNDLIVIARVIGLSSPSLLVEGLTAWGPDADLPPVRRPVDSCAAPETDGAGGGL